MTFVVQEYILMSYISVYGNRCVNYLIFALYKSKHCKRRGSKIVRSLLSWKKHPTLYWSGYPPYLFL